MNYDFDGLVSYFGDFSRTNSYKSVDFSSYDDAIDTFTVRVFSDPSLKLGLSSTSSSSGSSSSLGSSYLGGSIGLGVATIGAFYNSAADNFSSWSRAGVGAPEELSPSIYGNSILGLVDKADISKEVAGVLQTVFGADSNMNFNVFSTLLSDNANALKTGDSASLEKFNADGKRFVENIGALDDATINAAGRTLSDRIFNKASSKDGIKLDDASLADLARDANDIGTQVAKNLTVVRNIANSLTKEYSPDDGSPGLAGSPSLTFSDDRTAVSTIARFSETYGGQGRRASEGLDTLMNLGFVPEGQAGGDGAEGPGPGVTQYAATFVQDAIVARLHGEGIYDIPEERLDVVTAHISGQMSSWVTAYAKVNDKLSNTPNGGITSGDLNDYVKLAEEYDRLPITVGADGQLVVKKDALSMLRDVGMKSQQASIAKIVADAGGADKAWDSFAGYEDKLNRPYTGDNLVLATEAMREGNALKVMSERPINVPGKNKKMSFRELQQGIANGTITDTSFLLDPTSSDALSFLDYLNRWNKFGAASPTIVAKLASDTQRGYFFDTNTFTGEMSMNGSNWLMFLMAAGGLLSPLASKLFDAEIERKTTRKNQKYADQVRKADQEFQERLIRMQLESAEAQTRIAADSKKAVATGGSRTGVTINSPTQSK